MSLEKLKELIETTGTEDIEALANTIYNSGEMIPKDKYFGDIAKLKEQNKDLDKTWKEKFDVLDLENHNLKTANMTDAEKKDEEIKRLTKIADEANLKINQSEARAKFAKAGITDEEKINALVETFVDADKVKSTKQIDAFLTTMSDFRKEAKAQVENEIIDEITKVDSGKPADAPEPQDEIDKAIEEAWE